MHLMAFLFWSSALLTIQPAPLPISVFISQRMEAAWATQDLLHSFSNAKAFSNLNRQSFAFLFERKGIFKFEPAKLNLDELELDLIDAGAEDIERGDEETIVYTKFTEFGHMQKFLESKHLEAKSSELAYIPNTTKELSEAQQDEVLKLIETLEGDDDVQQVYHNLA
jgi:transcriptional/translational regulatory protein YebC/TACO1